MPIRWYKCQVNPQWSHDETIGLKDIGLNKSQVQTPNYYSSYCPKCKSSHTYRCKWELIEI